MNKLHIATLVPVVFGLVLILAGCGKGIKPPPTINVEIRASETVNPDDSGRPSPIVIRIYALKSDGGFNASDFYSLYNDDSGQLGPDLLDREEMHLMPGRQKIHNRELPLGTHYLGVVAAYRQLDQASWKDSIPIPESKTTDLLIMLDTHKVFIRSK